MHNYTLLSNVWNRAATAGYTLFRPRYYEQSIL